MYVCTNCGTQLEELYRRYCTSVLKLLKCERCDALADKYIEYDPAIIFVDLILIQKQAYRHLLYNSNLKSFWKLLIVLWLVESCRSFSFCGKDPPENLALENILDANHNGNCNFYMILARTAISIGAFLISVLLVTELWWTVLRGRPRGYTKRNLVRALVIGASGKLLGFLGIVWRSISVGPHFALIQVYTVLCLLTAYSVVCRSGKLASSLVLSIGILSYLYATPLLSLLFPISFLEDLNP